MPRQKIDNKQINLLDYLENLQAQRSEQQTARPGSLNVQHQVREAITQAISQSGISRYQVAASMSELVGSEVTKSMLDSWTAESKEYHRFPFEFLPALCEVTKTITPLEIAAQALKVFLLPGVEALRAEIQRLDEQEKKIKAEKKKRITFLEQIGHV